MYHMYMSMCSFNKRRLSSIIPPISLFSQILCAKRLPWMVQSPAVSHVSHIKPNKNIPYPQTSSKHMIFP